MPTLQAFYSPSAANEAVDDDNNSGTLDDTGSETSSAPVKDVERHDLATRRQQLSQAVLGNDIGTIDLIIDRETNLARLSFVRREPSDPNAGHGTDVCWYMATLALGLRAETATFRHLIELGLTDWTSVDEEVVDSFVMDICDAEKTHHLDAFLDMGGVQLLSHRQLGAMLIEVIAASATKVDGRVPGPSLVINIIYPSLGNGETDADPNFTCVLMLPDCKVWMGSMEGNAWSDRSAICTWSSETSSFLFPLHDVDEDNAVCISPLSVAMYYGQIKIFLLLKDRGASLDCRSSALDDSSLITKINLQVPAYHPFYVVLDRLGTKTSTRDHSKWLSLLADIKDAGNTGNTVNARVLVRFGREDKAFQMYVTPALLILARLARTGHYRPPWQPHQGLRDVKPSEALLTTVFCQMAKQRKPEEPPQSTLNPSVEMGGSTKVRSPFHLLMDGFREPGTDTHSGRWDILLDKDHHSFNHALFDACIKMGALARDGGEVLAKYYIQPTSPDVNKYRKSWRQMMKMFMTSLTVRKVSSDTLGCLAYQYVKTLFGTYRGHEHGHGVHERGQGGGDERGQGEVDERGHGHERGHEIEGGYELERGHEVLDMQKMALQDEVASVFPAPYEFLCLLSRQHAGIINYRPVQGVRTPLHHAVTVWPFVNMMGLKRTLSMAKAAFIHWLIRDLGADQHLLWEGLTPRDHVVQQTERAFDDGRKDKMFDEEEEVEMRAYLARFMDRAFGSTDQAVKVDADKKQRRASFGNVEDQIRGGPEIPKH